MTGDDNVIKTTLLDGQVQCLQPKVGYRVAIDTVLLAAAIPAKSGNLVVDVGAGVGGAGLCLLSRVDGLTIDALEIQPEYAALARRNARLNAVRDRYQIVEGSVGEESDGIKPDSYDHVMTNPPFVEAGRGQISPDPAKAKATMESGVPLVDWIAFCIRIAKTKGTITIIHRADRVDEILSALSGKVGDLAIFPLWPGGDNPEQPAKRVIVQGRKGMKGPTVLSKGLVLHEAGGDYTAKTKGILVNAEALEIGK
jgi:tRNA1(Val) A37 N6-methylase TrmN6